MAHFEATVRLLDISEPDAATARRTLNQRLRDAGFQRWHVISLGPHGTLPPVRGRRARSDQLPNYLGGGLLIGAVAAWALWFLWLLIS